MKRPQTTAKADDSDDNTRRDLAIQQTYAAFVRDHYQAAASPGVYRVEKDDLKRAEKLPVEDGRYRIHGYDWILEFRGGKFFEATKARPDTDPTDIISVPAAHAQPGG